MTQKKTDQNRIEWNANEVGQGIISKNKINMITIIQNKINKIKHNLLLSSTIS